MSLKERLHNIAEALEIIPKPPIVERSIGSLPTAGNNDDGNGWEQVPDELGQGRVIYERKIERPGK